jgi:hypothetical protein
MVAFSLISRGITLVRRRSSSKLRGPGSSYARGCGVGPGPGGWPTGPPGRRRNRRPRRGTSGRRRSRTDRPPPGRHRGRGIPHGVEVGQHLGRLVVRELSPDVGEAVESAADPDRGRQGHLDGLDHPRGPVGRDRARRSHPPGEQVVEELGLGGRRLLVADGQVQQVLAAGRVDRPGDEEGLLGPLAAERLEDGVARGTRPRPLTGRGRRRPRGRVTAGR